MGYEVPNHTQTPNELFDEHMKEMSGAELKVILAICRKTFGWHKDRDQISTSQMMELTGLSNRAVIDAIKKLMGRGLIARRQLGEAKTSPYEYAMILSAYEKSSQAGMENSSQASKGQLMKKVHIQKKGNKSIHNRLKKNYLGNEFIDFIENK
jgi:phage replication O-like protein O